MDSGYMTGNSAGFGPGGHPQGAGGVDQFNSGGPAANSYKQFANNPQLLSKLFSQFSGSGVNRD